MVGVITSRDVLFHPISTIRCFGWGVFFRAAAPWSGKPFLSVLQEAGCFAAAAPKVPSILERCIILEQRTERVYRILAAAFSDQHAVSEFFSGLAVQEQSHADLLSVCRAASRRTGWNVKRFNPWHDYVPRIEEQMDDVEAAVGRIDSVEVALQLVLQIESSEINEVFCAALAATDAAFVKGFKSFRDAMRAHINYIVEQVSRLAPQLASACEGLRARAA
jgi:hypothetical protein